MVKELTMDNTIFGLGSAKNMNAVESNVDMSSNEFEKVFETTQYADKSELKADNQKVLKAAEKSVSRENGSYKKDAATDITRVNKKVSAKLTSKSPKNADSGALKASNVRVQKEVDTTTNAYSFSVKESLNVEEKVSAESVVEVSDMAEPVVEDVKVVVEADVQQETTLESVEVGSSEEVVNLESSNPQTVENVAVVAQNVVAEIVKTVAEKVSALTVDTNEECEETTANIDVVELVENTDELLEEGLSLDILSDKELEIPSNVTTELESDIHVLSQQLQDVDVEENVDNSKITLGEGWEVVAEDEQLLTKEELDAVVANAEVKDMDVLDIEDVNLHTPEEIEARKELKQEIPNEINLSIDSESVDVDSKVAIKNVHTSKVEDSVLESEVKIETGMDFVNIAEVEVKESSKDVKNDAVEFLTKESVETEVEVDVVDSTNFFENSEQNFEQKSEIDLEMALDDSFDVENNIKDSKEIAIADVLEDVDFVAENTLEPENTVSKIVDENVLHKESDREQSFVLNEVELDVQSVAKDVMDVESKETVSDIGSINNTEELPVDNEIVDFKLQEGEMLLDKIETIEQVSLKNVEVLNQEDGQNNIVELDVLSTEEKNIQVKELDVLQSEDLDAYIDTCIKLAYVEPAVKQVQEQDVISVLESKFVEDISIEENIEYASSNDEMYYNDEDVAAEVEYEQVASLDELVGVEEVDDLKLQLKEQVSVMSEKTTIASSSNSTTEQMIRFAIEGETGFEPTMQLSNTFKPQTTLSQQAFQPTAKDVLAQLSEKLSTFNLNAGSKLTMQLSPENLGKIEISLTNTAKGVIAEMMVSSDDTCELMKKNIEDLKDTLQKYGVRFDNVTVKTAPSQQSSSNQDYTEQQGNAHKQNHEQKREEKNNERSFDDTFSSFTEEQDEE